MKPHDHGSTGLSSGDGHPRGHGHENASSPESGSGSPASRTRSDTRREGSPPKSSDEVALVTKIKVFREAVIKVLEQSGRPVTYPALRAGLKKHGLLTLGLGMPVRIGAVCLGVSVLYPEFPGQDLGRWAHSGAGSWLFLVFGTVASLASNRRLTPLRVSLLYVCVECLGKMHW